MKKEQKNKNGRVITDYNKIDMIDDYNYYSITRIIINTRCKKHKSLILSDTNKYFGYSDGDDSYTSILTTNKVEFDKVAKDFNILESEKPYLKKYMYDFSIKDLYTLNKNRDFANFLVKYNFTLKLHFDED